MSFIFSQISYQDKGVLISTYFYTVKNVDIKVKYLASGCQFFYRYVYGRLPVEQFTVKYLASGCQFFYRYFYGRLPVEHFFFPLRVDLIAKSYCMLCGHCQFAPYNIGQQNTVHFHHIFNILFGQRNQYLKKNQLNLIIRQDTAMGVLLYLKKGRL